MKKWVLMFGGALTTLLFLSACTDNMKDKEIKTAKYYSDHPDEAKEKYEWCLKKVKPHLTSEQFEILEKVFKNKKDGNPNQYSYGQLMRIVYEPLKEMSKQGELDKVNSVNCSLVFNVFF